MEAGFTVKTSSYLRENLLYFEVLEKKNVVIFCFIQDLYKNRGVKDSLIFRKTNDEYKLIKAFHIDNQEYYQDICRFYKMNFT